jgi:hypothetical protein
MKIELTPGERGSTREIRCIGWMQSSRIPEPISSWSGSLRHVLQTFREEDPLGFHKGEYTVHVQDPNVKDRIGDQPPIGA